MLLQNINFSALGLVLIIYLIVTYLWHRFFSLHGLPSSLPWAGAANNDTFFRARATKQSFFGLRKLIQSGYQTYSKQNKPFVLPNLVTGPEVILPMSQMRWLLEQPDHILNQNDVNSEFLHASRTMLHRHIIRDGVHGHVVRREMTKELDTYSDDIADEIRHALALNWGTSSDWHEIPVYDIMLDIIGRISNRVLVGKALCRNPRYLKSTTTFSRNVIITAGLMNLIPAILRPVLCPLIMAYDMFHFRNLVKFIVPIVRTRQSQFHPGMDYKRPDYSKHNDYIQWALHDAYSHEDLAERDPEMITKRLAVLSFAAIQSSVITITNLLFDIASSPSSHEIQEKLRHEVQETTGGKTTGIWTRACLLRMTHIDSALRESMRLWGFLSRGVMKKVVAPGGITIPSGEHLPHGTNVGVTSYAIHHDENSYPNAMSFDAFRFVDQPDSKVKACKAHFLTTTSEKFLGFSHGRHACPGRFFAAHQLKLLVAQIVQDYEFESSVKRPANPWLNNSIGPPIWAKLRVRYRHARPRPTTLAKNSIPIEPAAGLIGGNNIALSESIDAIKLADFRPGHEMSSRPMLAAI